jgi:hypothetical protein
VRGRSISDQPSAGRTPLPGFMARAY